MGAMSRDLAQRPCPSLPLGTLRLNPIKPSLQLDQRLAGIIRRRVKLPGPRACNRRRYPHPQGHASPVLPGRVGPYRLVDIDAAERVGDGVRQAGVDDGASDLGRDQVGRDVRAEEEHEDHGGTAEDEVDDAGDERAHVEGDFVDEGAGGGYWFMMISAGWMRVYRSDEGARV
jgi:hypothetical protein